MRGTAARLAALARPVRGIWIALSIGLGVIAIASSAALAATARADRPGGADERLHRVGRGDHERASVCPAARLCPVRRTNREPCGDVRLLGQCGRLVLRRGRAPCSCPPEPIPTPGDLLTRVIDDVQTLEGFYVRVLIPPLVVCYATVFCLGIARVLAVVRSQIVLAVASSLPACSPRCSICARPARLPAVVDAQARLNEELLDEVEGLLDLMVFDPDGNRRRRAMGTARALGGAQRRLARVRGAGTAAVQRYSGGSRALVLALAVGLTSSGNLMACTRPGRARHGRGVRVGPGPATGVPADCPRAWRRRVAPSSCWTRPRGRGAGRAAPPCRRGGVNRDAGHELRLPGWSAGAAGH